MTGIKLPPSVVSPPKPSSTGTTGTQSAFQPGKPQGTTGTQPAVKPQDLFGSASAATAAQAQLTGRDEVRPAGALASDLKGIADAEALPGRLAADLGIHLPELIHLLSLTRQQKATRLVEFLMPYAEKLADLAQRAAAASNPMPEAQREQLSEKLLAPMREAGLAQVVETKTGQTGVEVAEQLLNAKTPQEVRQLAEPMKFDAPQWASRPEAQGANEVKRGEPPLIAQPNVAPPREQRRPEEEEAAKKKDRGTDQKLGGNMVWNTLHFLRGDDAEELTPEKQKEMLMATGGIIVVFVVVAVAITLALLLK